MYVEQGIYYCSIFSVVCQGANAQEGVQRLAGVQLQDSPVFLLSSVAEPAH